ncbi:MAG TPA: hypothetical protein VGL81_05460 [Polyangiaceae bacterium]
MKACASSAVGPGAGGAAAAVSAGMIIGRGGGGCGGTASLEAPPHAATAKRDTASSRGLTASA